MAMLTSVDKLTFVELCQLLSKWISISQGVIPIEEAGYDANLFSRQSELSERDLCQFEQRHCVTLPEDYRLFLTDVGAVDLFYPSGGITIHSPIDYEAEISSLIFCDGEDPFPQVMVVASMLSGTCAGFVMDKLQQYSQFAVFTADVPPDYWATAHIAYRSFTDWLYQEINGQLEANQISFSGV